MSRIYDEDSKARSAHYQSVNERKGKQQYREESYVTLAGKGKHKFTKGRSLSGEGTPTPLACFRCGELGHRVKDCRGGAKKCLKCGKKGHLVAECKGVEMTCYNCGEPGHFSAYCQKSK